MDLVEMHGRRGRIVVVCNGHEVGDGNLAVLRAERGLKDVGIREVLLARVHDGAGGTDPEVAAHVLVEYGGENAWGVEAREAAPVDGAVGPDERCGGHVAYESVWKHT